MAALLCLADIEVETKKKMLFGNTPWNSIFTLILHQLNQVNPDGTF